ncbi:MAG: hypothetical protein IIZ40_04255 [Bacilli bacterium]|nr:hypothetical protein [Bacilli bacterium]
MEKLKYEIVTLKDGKRYFVLEDLLYQFDTYDLILNVEDENDIQIVLQEVRNGKTILTPVTDNDLLNELSLQFEENIRNKQQNL